MENDLDRTRARLDALIVSQPVDYGVAVHVRQLTEAAVAAGHRVTVVSPGTDRGPLAGWVEAAGARHVTLDMRRSPSARDPFHALAIRRLARGRDIVHLHSSKASALGRVATASLPRRRRPPVVVTPHSWSWSVGGRLAGLYRWVERRLAGRADVIVSVSEREAIEGRENLGGAARIQVVPNGVDRGRFAPSGPRAERDVACRLIVCVGRLSEQKGQDVAIRALPLLRDASARLRLVGEQSDPGERDRLQRLAASLGVTDRVEWRGLVDDAAPEYRAADVVVVPSRWEGMSLAVLEALSCGSAIVATDVSGSEVLGDAAIIIPLAEPEELAAAIDPLLEDDERRAALERAARAQSRPYDVRVAMETNLDVWAALADRGRSVRPSGGVRVSSTGGAR
jgi:glycosyltransferase involved in cell wall biosynthesis